MIVQDLVEVFSSLHHAYHRFLCTILADSLVDAFGRSRHSAKSTQWIKHNSNAGCTHFFKWEKRGLAEFSEIRQHRNLKTPGKPAIVFKTRNSFRKYEVGSGFNM